MIYSYAQKTLRERFDADRNRYWDLVCSCDWQAWPSTSFSLFETDPELGGTFLVGEIDEDLLVEAIAQLAFRCRHVKFPERS